MLDIKKALLALHIEGNDSRLYVRKHVCLIISDVKYHHYYNCAILICQT